MLRKYFSSLVICTHTLPELPTADTLMISRQTVTETRITDENTARRMKPKKEKEKSGPG